MDNHIVRCVLRIRGFSKQRRKKAGKLDGLRTISFMGLMRRVLSGR